MRAWLGALLFSLGCSLAAAQNPAAAPPASFGPAHGPARGALLITGGATEHRDYVRFVDLAGGPGKADIVVIPNASVTKPTPIVELQEQYCGAKSPFGGFPGLKCTVMYTDDRKMANSAAYLAPLASATGVWFVGGRHWRIADVYVGTLAQREFRNVLARGGVIGGGSAGATIQGSYMVRGSAQPDDNTILMAPGHEIGLAFFENATIDQHVDVRHRENDLAPVIAAHPGLLGLGLDQATSITVRGDTLVSNGPGVVRVWDGKDHNGKGYYLLHTGDRLDVATRVPVFAAQP